MSVGLTEARHRHQLKRIDTRVELFGQTARLEENIRCPLPPVTSDGEMAFVKKAAMWMLVLSVTPLILFFIVNYVYPELFLVPITPN